MVPNKSLDEYKVIAALLRDAHKRHGAVFNTAALKLTTLKVGARMLQEGIGFLTKTLPRLGKHFDQVLAGNGKMDAISCGFKPASGCKYPKFLGELFQLVISKDGDVLHDPDASCVRTLRLLLYCFYKYELPYNERQESQVLSDFCKAEKDLADLSHFLACAKQRLNTTTRRRAPIPLSDPKDRDKAWDTINGVVREARIALARVFSAFDCRDIVPRHGPGVVATKQTLERKFLWTNVSKRITDLYPFDAYFCASLGHVCDTYSKFEQLGDKDSPARVLLVPKDSRGPRLISCEPVDFQWIQQGLSKAIVERVESHPLTKGRVNFTDQETNRRLAFNASIDGKYSTLDLKEASDRVHLELVRLLFPEEIIPFLEGCRSRSTVLPDNQELELHKYAPMGSALCFPIMALTIWALLYGYAPDADTRKSIYVYGDDVIVPSGFTASAMSILELFGLKINQSKSCTQGFFRESCGMDAFKGVDVTPVRFRTVMDKSPSPSTYSSWISYANSLYDRGCIETYNFIVGWLVSIYGPIPGEDMNLSCPSLRRSPFGNSPFPRRWNRSLQKLEYRVRVLESPSIHRNYCGWSKLLRYFTEGPRSVALAPNGTTKVNSVFEQSQPFTASRYTKRRVSKLTLSWR